MTTSLAALMTLSMLTGAQSGVCTGVNDPRPPQPPCTPEDVEFDGTVVEVDGDVECTLTLLADFLGDTVVAPVPEIPQGWLLKADLLLRRGATLRLHGAWAGGDVDELRLLSTPERFISIQADPGTIDIHSTRITSWDANAGSPDLIHEDGRAFLAARSFLDDDEPQESRMDVRDSDIGYLGHFGEAAYGLAWRVRGTGESGEMSPVFNKVEVYGVIHNSRIHHNYMGSYSWGAFCMEWVGNDVGPSEVYGIDPHDNSDYLLIANNHVHHAGTHGIICSKNCDHLTIRNNVTHHNGRHGIMLHLNITASVIEGNRSYDNGGWGIAIFDSHSNTVRENDTYRNEFGIHIYEQSRYNVVERNVAHDNLEVGIRFASGARANQVHDNTLFANDRSGLDDQQAEDQILGDNLFERIDGHDHPLSNDPLPGGQDPTDP